MTTRSAFGTAVIIRRLVISRMRARTLPLTSALPSSSFCSCFSSWWLIFSRSPCRRFCSGTSMPAKAASASRIRPHAGGDHAGGGGDRHRQGQREHAHELAHMLRKPERADAAEDEGEHARLQRIDHLLFGEDAAQTRERVEDVKLRPERLERPGPAAHGERARHAAATMTRPNGTTAQSSVVVQASICPVIASSRSAWAPSKRSERASESRSQSETRGAATRSAAPPPATAAKWPRSRERATWPSARALSSLRGEAGRFLSWAELEAMRRLFQRRWQTSAIKTSIDRLFAASAAGPAACIRHARRCVESSIEGANDTQRKAAPGTPQPLEGHA